MAKILVAASPEPRAIVGRILARHQLTFVETMPQAQQLLREGAFDLIICTIVFDESKMFDFLRHAKSSPEGQSIPFVCARLRSHILRSSAALEAVAYTCRAMGALAFLDIADFQADPEREWGDAVERILETIARTEK